MARTPYKMKGSPMQRNFASAFKDKPTKKELLDAANNVKNLNHKNNQESDAHYYAWQQGLTIPKKKAESTDYHGTGGKVMNEDGSVDLVKSKQNQASIKLKNKKT